MTVVVHPKSGLYRVEPDPYIPAPFTVIIPNVKIESSTFSTEFTRTSFIRKFGNKVFHLDDITGQFVYEETLQSHYEGATYSTKSTMTFPRTSETTTTFSIFTVADSILINVTTVITFNKINWIKHEELNTDALCLQLAKLKKRLAEHEKQVEEHVEILERYPPTHPIYRDDIVHVKNDACLAKDILQMLIAMAEQLCNFSKLLEFA